MLGGAGTFQSQTSGLTCSPRRGTGGPGGGGQGSSPGGGSAGAGTDNLGGGGGADNAAGGSGVVIIKYAIS